MRRRALSVIGCPSCFGPLQATTVEEVVEEGQLRCDRDGIEFSVMSGIPELVLPANAERVEGFARAYSQTWGTRGPAAFKPSQLLSLPHVGRFSKKGWTWRVKARSWEALLNFLNSRSPHRILDLGCGVGWLSYRLAMCGYEVYGADIIRRGPVGLEASQVYGRRGADFERVRGEMERPPFQDRSFDVVVCNASIHFSRSLGETLIQGLRLLVPGGSFVMMNSPVHSDSNSAQRAQQDAQENFVRLGAPSGVASLYRHFTFSEVREAFRSVFGSMNEVPWDGGLAFRWVRKTQASLLHMEVAKFPLLWASKQDG
jgi:SAM-dependent methyltransferase